MNEGAAKAYRRNVRARGESTLDVPGKAIKALWGSLNHKQRGEWRRKFGPTRAARLKTAARSRDFLDEIVLEGTKTDPEFPRLVAEALARRVAARNQGA